MFGEHSLIPKRDILTTQELLKKTLILIIIEANQLL